MTYFIVKGFEVGDIVSQPGKPDIRYKIDQIGPIVGPENMPIQRVILQCEDNPEMGISLFMHNLARGWTNYSRKFHETDDTDSQEVRDV